MATERRVIDAMLKPYLPNCRYLKEADISYPRGRGNFSIPESCYIEGTGHFNAVEALICYNQLAYTLFADAFNRGQVECTDRIPLEEYIEYQLPNTFIVTMDKFKFRKPIDPRNFYGEIEVKKSKRAGQALFADTKFNFWDNKTGRMHGEMVVALGNLPANAQIGRKAERYKTVTV